MNINICISYDVILIESWTIFVQSKAIQIPKSNVQIYYVVRLSASLIFCVHIKFISWKYDLTQLKRMRFENHIISFKVMLWFARGFSIFFVAAFCVYKFKHIDVESSM